MDVRSDDLLWNAFGANIGNSHRDGLDLRRLRARPRMAIWLQQIFIAPSTRR
jgi:hypothetical protein